MIERPDNEEIREPEGLSERERRAKAAWTSPELSRILSGAAESNPGDSHADGTSTFS